MTMQAANFVFVVVVIVLRNGHRLMTTTLSPQFGIEYTAFVCRTVSPWECQVSRRTTWKDNRSWCCTHYAPTEASLLRYSRRLVWRSGAFSWPEHNCRASVLSLHRAGVEQLLRLPVQSSRSVENVYNSHFKTSLKHPYDKLQPNSDAHVSRTIVLNISSTENWKPRKKKRNCADPDTIIRASYENCSLLVLFRKFFMSISICLRLRRKFFCK